MANKALDNFNSFQLAEYQHIATAHFETSKQIAIFFRYYLLFFSVPLILITLFKEKSATDLIKILDDNSQAIGIVFGILAIIGLGFSIYVIDLRNDSILYARTVNGIRKYFYDRAGRMKIQEYQVLPTNIKKPKYFKFSPLIGIVFFVNTVYFSFSFYFLFKDYECLFFKSSFISIAFLCLHVLIFYLKCRNHNNGFSNHL